MIWPWEIGIATRKPYNQNAGIFTSQDPLGCIGGVNPYRSRRNNALIHADHNGKNPLAYAVNAFNPG